MKLDELLNYIVSNRTAKPNKNTFNMYKVYLEEMKGRGVSMKQIREEFSNGLTISLFEDQVRDYFN